MSEAAKKRYINSSNRKINISKLKADSTALPQRHRNWNSFKQSFGNVNHYNCELHGYKVYIDVRYAFKHFFENTYSEHRGNINATIMPTLHDPLLVVKEKYEGKNALTFYKPFTTNEDLLHILMHKAVEDEHGVYRFKTIFEAHSIKKIADIINKIDINTVYFKFD